jgi:hypothetical protein
MKKVIPTDSGSISSDSTANARMINYQKGVEIELNDEQADFLVSCGKATFPREAEALKQKTKTK